MKTLYELLGALPDDNAEELRAAFRRAVKGAHPDLNPGDPDAALKFRQIVRASEILSDGELRATYDHLLVLADREEKAASGGGFAASLHRLASGVMAVAGLSIMTAGGYLLFMHISVASAPSTHTAGPGRGPMALAALPQPDRQTSSEPNEILARWTNVDAPADTSPTDSGAAIGDTVAAASPEPGSNLAGSFARSYRARAIAAYQVGDLNGAIADLDQAIQLDPKFSAAYIDRATIFYRLQKFKQTYAFADWPKKPGATKSATTNAARKHAKTIPGSLERAAAQDREVKVGMVNWH
jgi:tetratricopeptide (TPR) repeat protein